MKTSELTGAALDWAVAKCEGKNGVLHDDGITRCIVVAAPSGVYKGTYRPSINWAQGGPIIEREGIAMIPGWTAERPGFSADGLTPLIAAMRCYVASRLGDKVELPEAFL